MAVTDRIYVKDHRRLSSRLDTRFPRNAFSGATLDLLFGAETLDALSEADRARILDFAADFLDCDCESNPHCGHPERKFVRYLLDLRAQGLDPGAMVDVMSDEYLVYAFAGDVRSFLDDAVRTLEAMADFATVEGDAEMEAWAERRATDLVG